jgi:putative 4-mercaptohistidine N1-methyltranferase
LNIYETDRLLSEYLLFHYGEDAEVLPWPSGPTEALRYPVRCVSECFDLASLPARGRALDLGCAVGRSTFELARHCADVVGIDFSARFIAAARQLRQAGEMPYSRADEGALTTPLVARVPAEIDRKRLRFEPGDAMELRGDIGTFDAVLMANLLDRLRNPFRCLAQLPALVNPGGQMVITTPCTWLEDFTPRENWLGGFLRDGRPLTTRDALQELLDADFELIGTKDLPFLIREHQRKFQWSVAQATTWRRRTT